MSGIVEDSPILTGPVQRMSLGAKRAILVSVDVVLTAIALGGAALLVRPGTVFIDAAVLAPAVMGSALLVAGIGSVLLGLADMRLADYAANGAGRSAGLAVVAIGTAHVAGHLAGSPPRLATMVIAVLLTIMLWIVARAILLKLVTEIWKRGRSVTRVLIYGAGVTGQQLAKALSRDGAAIPVAFVDDSPILHGRRVAGLPVHAPTELDALAARHGTTRIALAIPSLSHPSRMMLARRLGKRGFDVEVVPSFSQLVGAESIAETLASASPETLMGRPALGSSLDSGAGAYEERSVMISGAGGSIGLELCRQVLACRPRRLVLYELSEFNLFEAVGALEAAARDVGCDLVPVLGSITDPVTVPRVLAENSVEVVLHAAAFKHVHIVEANAVAGVVNNVIGTYVLAHAARRARCERFVLVSSDKAVRPRGLMGASKRMAEMVVQDVARRCGPGGPVFSMVRFGNVMDSSGSVLPRFREQVRQGGPVTVTHPDMERFFMSIDEAARLVLMAGSIAEGGEVFVLDMGKPRRIVDIACEMIREQGYDPRLPGEADGDVVVEFSGLRPGEKLREELLIGPGDRATQHPKIFRARERAPDREQIADMMRELRAAAKVGDARAMREAAGRWVEGYGSTGRPKTGPSAAGHSAEPAGARAARKIGGETVPAPT